MKKLQIKVSHKYSELDKAHQFGIEIQDNQSSDIYIGWVWFYLGAYLYHYTEKVDFRLFPYNVGTVSFTYQFCNDAQRQAKMIANRVIKKYLTA
jgi:hypothetical protein